MRKISQIPIKVVNADSSTSNSAAPLTEPAADSTAPNMTEQHGRAHDRYLMDGNKMLWHLDRVVEWQHGERVPPIHIDAGLSKGCNIKCHYCYGVTQGNFFRKGSERVFPREALLNYMRDAGELGVRSIALIGEAEPTLNPALYEAIVLGKTSGVDMSVGTNGALWDTGADGQAALEHLSWIRFNISAASDYTYRRIHASKSFPTVIEKIRFCVDYKRRQKLDLTVGLQMVLTPRDISEAVPLAKLGAELGVDYLVIKHCSDTVENDLGIFERLDDYDKFAHILKEAEGYSNEDYKVIVKWDKITNKGIREYDACLGAPFLLYSGGDGRLYTCGMFFDGKYAEDYLLGDLTKNSLKQIIESDHYWKVIDKVKCEIDVHKECYANCRTHSINNFLWDLQSPPAHKNFV
jgi:MoaA/NifB/PqqE/SkfB family radical SAM enzyme